MIAKSTLASALIIVGTTFAVAQTSPAPTSPPTPATPPVVMPEAKAPMPSGNVTWYSHAGTELRASKIIGTRVVNEANETVGNVNEVILGSDGKIAGLVIGVGGFLGIGEHEVAVSFNSVKMSRDGNNNLILAMNATRDSLKSAPAWTWKEAKSG